ncbi:hypothetical protein FHW69_002774 [Luteibacter sp. Sphag1AF]|uniref:hypothetical protein n=1 Tax=Luteibacter sp. Sphag1AF TaxID=2587031 RepID=UPI0016072B6A|nr:hypothetical protein [Luteibacter sp. Sphag1AF]MBB3228139.1 hypothetical protein [Luteibacter sp. Sphag1AF]
MAKGNHVFNDFDGCLASSFKRLAQELSLEKVLIAATSKGAQNSSDAATIRALFPNSYATLAEIRNHARVAQMHWIQDDQVVVADDPNSMAFGRQSERFKQSVLDWAWGNDDRDNPMTVWRSLVNAGEDASARRNFANGSSLEQAPKSKADRESLCQEVSTFIRGELSKLVGKWLMQLRSDMTMVRAPINGVTPVRVDYEGSRKDWLQRLASAGNIPITD